jgi:hypothetical protein
MGIEGATFHFLRGMMLVSILYLKQADLSGHQDDLMVNLMEQPDNNRRLRRLLPNNLPTTFLV